MSLFRRKNWNEGAKKVFPKLNSFRDSDKGLEAFGQEVRDQAVFTAWTLRKINSLCDKIDSLPLGSQQKEKDEELRGEFVFHAMCTRFCLDCLSKSMALNKPISPEVMPLILDGLRNAVNAYAYVRRGLELRDPKPQITPIPVDWDDEDEELLVEADYDLVEATA